VRLEAESLVHLLGFDHAGEDVEDGLFEADRALGREAGSDRVIVMGR
jgi:ssRNA-specific RNase YbeY (16S rRNA maturation enzyme)